MSNTNYVRPGFSTLTPYLIVHDAPWLIEFIVEVFGAQELRRDLNADGSIMNAEFRASYPGKRNLRTGSAMLLDDRHQWAEYER